MRASDIILFTVREVLECKSDASGKEIQIGLIQDVIERVENDEFFMCFPYKKVSRLEVRRRLKCKGYKIVGKYSGGENV